MRGDKERLSTSSTESAEWARQAGALVLPSPKASTSRRLAPSLNGQVKWEDRILEWDFNTLAVDKVTGGQSFVFVTDKILSYNKDYIGISISSDLQKFFAVAQSTYNISSSGTRVPFHNATHGADVLQAFHWFLKGQPGLFDVILTFIPPGMGPIALVACIVAAAMHDYDHQGVNNNYLIRTRAPLAILYNDRSVLENHHCASTFALLNSMHVCQGNMTNDEYNFFRELVVEMILSTDLTKHYDLMTNVPCPASDYRHCLTTALHCADLSNCARNPETCVAWTDLVLEEFFAQGDMERAIGLEVTPMMDRETADIGRVQTGFYDVICRPLFVHMEILCPDGLRECIENIDKNRLHWEKFISDPLS